MLLGCKGGLHKAHTLGLVQEVRPAGAREVLAHAAVVSPGSLARCAPAQADPHTNTNNRPPFPPRLLHIPTDPARYSKYEFLNPLSSERELPMIIDGELGMPMELGKIAPGQIGDGSYWLGKRSGEDRLRARCALAPG